MPKDREPVRLMIIYPFSESWKKVSLNEGQIEIDLQVTPTPTATVISTPEEKEVPGFEAIFAIVGLLAVVYLLRNRK